MSCGRSKPYCREPAGTLSTQTFSLTNTGNSAFNWSLGTPPSWLNVSIRNGTLAAGGGSASVFVTLNLAASLLSAGNYLANLWFTNLSSGLAQLRQFTLQVGSRNDNDYFCLDNVSVMPLPAPVLQTLAPGDGSIQLAWTALAGALTEHHTTRRNAMGQRPTSGPDLAQRSFFSAGIRPFFRSQKAVKTIDFTGVFWSGGRTRN